MWNRKIPNLPKYISRFIVFREEAGENFFNSFRVKGDFEGYNVDYKLFLMRFGAGFRPDN